MAYTPANTGFISTLNSTSANLTANSIFTGTSEDLTDYSIVEVSVYSSHDSATDGLSLQQSSDNANWDITDTYTIPAVTGRAFSVPTQARYFRLVYTNGSVGTTSLRIQAMFHKSWGRTSSVRPQDSRTNETDMEESLAYNMVYNGTTWDRARGNTTFGMDVDVTRFDPGITDTFGFLKVAQSSNVLDVNFYKTGLTNNITVSTGSTGSVTQPTGTGYGLFSTGTGTTSNAKGVTNINVSYVPGCEVAAIVTAAFSTPTDNNGYQRIGIYDTNNGFYVGYSGTVFNAVVRSGATDTYVAKSAWNIDPLTGGTTSKFTRNGVPEAIDLTKLNVWRIRYGWLGAAPIYYEVASPDDDWVLFHMIRQPNTAIGPSIANPDLPITCDVSKTSANATPLTIICGCWGINISYTPDGSATNAQSVAIRHRNPTYRVFVPAQAVGVYKVYFDLFNAQGSGRVIRLLSCVPLVSGSVAVTGTLGVDLFLQRTTAVGSGGTTATYDGTAINAMTIAKMDPSNINVPASITGRFTPTTTTSGSVISWCCVFTEETNASTYLGHFNDLVRRNQIDFQPVVINQGQGIKVIQGPIASVGNIGFDVIFELDT